ncbi:MAG: hypothetical protein HYX60_04550 [Legionella longbeachae]|nr:hypothetical protein [Legionella longbeachae]
MKPELAKKQLIEKHPQMSEKIKNNVFKALDSLSTVLDEFDAKHIEQIYQIEQINPSYFPGLSIASSNTIVALRQASSRLSLDFILDTVQKLAYRSRPWELLAAFSSFAMYCRSEINEENIKILMKVNSDIVEIVGSTIKNEMEDRKDKLSGKCLTFFSSSSLQYGKGLLNSIREEHQRYFPYSSLKI